MSHRLFNSICALVCVITTGLLASAPVAGQARSSAAKAVTKPWTQPRTTDGQPDLQGTWTNATITPFERPGNLAGKQLLTDEEAEALEEQAAQGRVDRPPRQGDVGNYNQFWFDRGNKVTPTKRTSLIVDPPDGRVPPLTPEAQKRMADRAAARRGRGPADGPEDRSLQERCIFWQTAGPPMIPGPYNNNYQIVQSPGYVVILSEMIHDVRIIPLAGQSHLGPSIRQWMGNSRGHWESNTLVVDTTGFNGKANFRNTSQNLHLIERFTRVDAETILYEFTVDDPTTFIKPWTAQIPMTRTAGPIFEYACNEGNYALTDILAGARAEEKAAAEAAKRDSK
jgi:hypothetical protein